MGEAFGLMQDVPRQGGFGPATDGRWVSKGGYDHPAAGWGAAFSVADVLIRTREPFAGTKAMFVMNHPGRGYDCPGCAWPDDKGVTLDICENGIKHVTWEMTHKRVGREFFQNHTVTELANWTDFDLEDQGRLTEPMVYNAATDRYEPISWDDAFAMIGEQLRALESPDQAAFYTSGRLSNEASFLYQLFSREYGTNNLPDCSNMCHEASGRALTASIATGKGTADLEDWDQCDALFVMGVNAASNAPRMLTTLAAAVDRGAQVVHVNPLIEAGATRTIVPHEIIDMATLHTTPTSTDNLQVRPGDDFALIRGMAKVVFEAAESDPKEETRPLLKEISWVGGFLDGVTIPLSPDLTALIGGRGTGKSTAIESLRYVLGLMPIGASAKADHEAIVSSVLRAGTVVKLTVEATSPRVQTFTIERSVNNTPVVKDASGTVTSLQSADVIGDVEIFGQHELAELASDSEKVASMLHRFQGNGDLTADHKETLARLKENRDKLTRAEKDKVELEDELTDIPRLEEQVRHFKETDVPTRLSEVTRLNQDEAVFSEGRSRVADAKSTLTGLTDTQLAAKLGATYDGLDESPQADTLGLVRTATTTLADTLKSLATQAQAAITAAETAVASAATDWTNAVREQREDHAQVLRKLVEDGLEPDKYLATTKALEDLKAKEPRLTSIDTNIKELVAARKTLLQELTEHENKRLEALHDAIRTANAATGGVVIVKPIAARDRRHIKTLIESAISGQRTQIMAAIDSDGFSTRAFVEAARKGQAELADKFSIRGAQARGVVDAGEALLRQLEELSVGNAVEVQLDIGAGTGTREFKKMDDLSKGQRATALLLLLLGASRAPLVIDQPEDDLDNRFVYDGVVKNLRELKGKRQIIASTHNANVPVLGDAELIVALEGSGRNGKPADGGIGSLDDALIRALAESILEGGPAAFNARQHLYGF